MEDHSPINRRYFLLCLLLLSLFWLTGSKAGCSFDTNYFVLWGAQIFNHGIGSVYVTDTNYMPLFFYFLDIYVWCQSSLETVQANIHQFKVASIIFHLLTGYIVLRILVRAGMKPESAFFNMFFYLFNAAVLYNTMIWNQVDIVLTAFVFASVYFAFRGRVLLSLIMYVLALNFKLQAIVFFPVVGLMLLPELIRAARTARIFVYFLVPGALQVAILLPYIIAGTAHRIPEAVFASVDVPIISVFAYNIWHLLIPGVLYQREDTEQFLGMAFKHWGLLMFCAASLAALFPLLRSTYRRITGRDAEPLAIDKIMLTCSLMGLAFFYFNTEMHERYSHPALVFLVTYCIIRKQAIPAALVCVAYVLNLEDELRYLELPNYDTVIFDPVFISILYLVSLLVLYVSLYRKTAASGLTASA